MERTLKLSRRRWHLAALASALLLGTALAASALRPAVTHARHPAGLLGRGIPEQLNGWTLAASPLPMLDLTVAGRNGERTNDNPYDEVLMRTYADVQGRHIMLAVAYAAEQRQEVKIHRPDLCYPSQGYRLLTWAEQPLETVRNTRGPISSVRMLTRRGTQHEAVLYWLRTGSSYGQAMWDGRWAMLQEGLHGRVPDGVLVRASMRLVSATDAEAAFALMEAFLGDLVQGSSAEALARLIR